MVWDSLGTAATSMDIAGKLLTKAQEIRSGILKLGFFHERFKLLATSLDTCCEHLKGIEKEFENKTSLKKSCSSLLKLAEEACQTMKQYTDHRDLLKDVTDVTFGLKEATRIDQLLQRVFDEQRNLAQCLGLQGFEDQQRIKHLLMEAAERDKRGMELMQEVDNGLTSFIHESRDNMQMLLFFQRLSSTLPESCVSTPALFQGVLAILKARLERHGLTTLQKGSKKSDFSDVQILKNIALRVVDDTEDVFKRMPQEFMSPDQKKTMSLITDDLKDHKQKLKDLTLRVCFVGPTKSGKSTTINAIVGEQLAPSHVFPMTVLPMILRHRAKVQKPELHLPSSQHYADAIKALKSRSGDRLDKLILRNPEVDFLPGERELYEEIRDGKFNATDSLPEKSEYDQLHQCSDLLSKLNHLCRLCARVNHHDGLDVESRIKNPLEALLDESKRKSKPCWPCIHLRMHMLTAMDFDDEGSEVFELMDTPGGSESWLIPEITPVVTWAIQDAACCVCVCDAPSAFSDSQRAIKLELSSCRNSPAVYILANKCDAITSKKDLATLVTGLAKQFLKHESKSGQVFPVIAKWELRHAMFKTLQRKHGAESIQRELQSLPDAAEGEEQGNPMTDLQVDLQGWAQDAYGSANWDEELRCSQWERHEQRNDNLHYKSKFSAFQNHLMHEVAPNAGRTVIRAHAKALLNSFDGFIRDLDFLITAFHQSDDEYSQTKKRLEAVCQRVDEVLVPGIEAICSEMKSKARALIFESEISRDGRTQMQKSVGEEIDKILQQSDEKFPGALFKCVDDRDLQEFSYLEKGWKGKAVWRFFTPDSALKFQSEQVKIAEEAASIALVDLSKKFLDDLRDEFEQFAKKIDAKLKSLQGEEDKDDCLQLNWDLANLPPVQLQMQGVSLTKDREHIKEFLLLWLWPIRWKGSDVKLILHDSEKPQDCGLKSTLQKRCNDAAQKSFSSLQEQVEKYVEEVKKDIIEKLTDDLEGRRCTVDELETRRKEENPEQLWKSIFMARLQLEGLKLDAKIVCDCSRPEDPHKYRYDGPSDPDELDVQEFEGKPVTCTGCYCVGDGRTD